MKTSPFLIPLATAFSALIAALVLVFMVFSSNLADTMDVKYFSISLLLFTSTTGWVLAGACFCSSVLFFDIDN